MNRSKLTERRPSLNNVQRLAHAVWDCKYHIVWIPKWRRKVLYGRIRKYLGDVFRELARQRESAILEGHLCSDHVRIYTLHLHSTPTEARGCASGRVHQGEECNPHSKNLWRSRQEFRRAALLGPRLLCHDRRSGRGSDPRIHPKARSRRPTA